MIHAPSRGRPRKTAADRDVAGAARQAIKQLVAQRGYAATHMRDVARASGVTPGALYHHYPNKEALLVAAIEEVLAGEADALEQLLPAALPAPEALLRLLRYGLTNLQGHEVLRRAALELPDPHRARVQFFFARSLFARVEQVLRVGVERGELRPHDTAVSGWTFLSVLSGLAEVPQGVTADLPEAVLDMLLFGLRAKD
ncbi:TetR/AcrR family transcriptional regulator [Deinococcus apachensis]|uniref:TetR/AcrR family transcriptional regulator n=1 Tax=Deinococcus apachensis TaxID=309886 RepID=UPI00035EB3F0|nr:TetR/AcrR family transcriptional regulator [Deinococcus apachensis]